LQATGCASGSIIWNYGFSGNSISVSPPQTKSYFAYCSQYGCTSDISNRFILTVNNCPLVLNLSNTNVQDNFNSGTLIKSANQNTGLIGANNYITGNANIKYLARKIELSPGFKAEAGTVFLAEIGGCQ
jgi:hypothetical protein